MKITRRPKRTSWESFIEFYFFESFGYLLLTSQNMYDPDFKLQWVSAFIQWGETQSSVEMLVPLTITLLTITLTSTSLGLLTYKNRTGLWAF